MVLDQARGELGQAGEGDVRVERQRSDRHHTGELRPSSPATSSASGARCSAATPPRLVSPSRLTCSSTAEPAAGRERSLAQRGGEPHPVHRVHDARVPRDRGCLVRLQLPDEVPAKVADAERPRTPRPSPPPPDPCSPRRRAPRARPGAGRRRPARSSSPRPALTSPGSRPAAFAAAPSIRAAHALQSGGELGRTVPGPLLRHGSRQMTPANRPVLRLSAVGVELRRLPGARPDRARHHSASRELTGEAGPQVQRRRPRAARGPGAGRDRSDLCTHLLRHLVARAAHRRPEQGGDVGRQRPARSSDRGRGRRRRFCTPGRPACTAAMTPASGSAISTGTQSATSTASAMPVAVVTWPSYGAVSTAALPTAVESSTTRTSSPWTWSMNSRWVRLEPELTGERVPVRLDRVGVVTHVTTQVGRGVGLRAHPAVAVGEEPADRGAEPSMLHAPSLCPGCLWLDLGRRRPGLPRTRAT